ncbi:MAG: L-serine ammonia-lyase, iron-sulfur-dependent, subunit alpha [Oscillospiraceae bacterium]|nr:L-serine ammonia-lyase, iron-sulfur-dependent, subunit alpha [Oscillospiraceae bacterium]
MKQEIYQAYLDILKEELVPAMGCTEPIAIAYAAALARQTLGAIPERTVLTVSGNILKNVKSVIVPNTGGRKGIRVAAAAGICFGIAERELEVLSESTEEQLSAMDRFLETANIQVRESVSNHPFDLEVELFAGEDTAYVRIVSHHTNVVCLRKNQQVILEKPFTDETVQAPENRRLLNVEDIVRFADEARIEDVRDLLQRQIDCNTAIAEAGLTGEYGAGIGRILLLSYGNSVHNRAKAWAAAGSDARMGGCELPVVINSGSGNQGLTASIPVIIYARECGVSEEQLYRALLIANLVTIHLKTGIGSLSAYCGATSAGAGAGAGICYLYGGKYDEIAHTIVNALAINSGMICDGAKPSCAAKIASAVESGLLGMRMFMHDSQFYGGDGIVVKGVENTIRAVSTIARDGMRSTDREVIRLMIENE